MGRKKKDVSTSQTVKSFTEIKEEGVAGLLKKKDLSIEQEVVDKFDVKPVRSIAMLGGQYIMDFTGKNYEESLKLAYEWKDRYEKDHKDTKVNFVNYYPQVFMHKTILISYNLKVR